MDLNENVDQPLITTCADGEAWVVLHTRPRCEKKVARYCEEQGYNFYLPLRRRAHRYGGRRRTFHSPLFPGYVFCVMPIDKRVHARQNVYIANILVIEEQSKFVHQLEQVKRAVESGDSVEVLPYLAVGKRVEVTGGPFEGMEGVVIREKGKERFVILVEMISQSVVMDMDMAFLGPVIE